MHDYFFSLPYAIFGVPTLLLAVILFVSILVGFIDMGFELDSDSASTPLGEIWISSGISKVPLMVGLLVTFTVAHVAVYITHYYILTPTIPSLANIVIYILHPFYFVGSLYVAGYLLSVTGISKLFEVEESEKPVCIIGLHGEADYEISSQHGKGIVQIPTGTKTFLARTHEDAEPIPMHGKFTVIAKHPDYEDTLDGEIYIVENKA